MGINAKVLEPRHISRYHRCDLPNAVFQPCTTGETQRFAEDAAGELRKQIREHC